MEPRMLAAEESFTVAGFRLKLPNDSFHQRLFSLQNQVKAGSWKTSGRLVLANTKHQSKVKTNTGLELVLRELREFDSGSESLEQVIEILRRLRFIEAAPPPSKQLRRQQGDGVEIWSRVKHGVQHVVWTYFVRRRNPPAVRKKKKIQIRSEPELVVILRWIAQWLKAMQRQMMGLRLGLVCLKLWNAFTVAYASSVRKLVLRDLVSRRVCCPVLEHINRSSRWRSFQRKCRNNDEDSRPSPENRFRKHQVDCKVDVVSWRERSITACIRVDADIDRVWNVLTDYERLAEFIPNLIHSVRIPCPYPGRIWLLQRGLHTAMYWHIEATVVLDLEEIPYSVDGKSLQFCMVDGDFKKYIGRWLLKPGTHPGTTNLIYEVNVIPRLLLPGVFVERIIKSDLPVNLRAISERAERNQGLVVKVPADSATPVATPIQSIVSKVTQASSETTVRSFVQSDDKLYAEKWDSQASTKVKKVCRSDSHCTIDEVHLRRLSEEDGGAWRVAAAVTIAGSLHDVWNVLTDYEALSEFVPNLSSSRIVSRDGHKVRLVQEGCKCLLYMVLHARVVLELHEQPTSEISFHQLEGDFCIFKGKWTLESLGSKHTLLRYSVDLKMHHDFLLPREIIEGVVYEDLPENLCAIRARVELGDGCFINPKEATPSLEPAPENVVPLVENVGDKKTSESTGMPKREPVPRLQHDFQVLERELRGFVAKLGRGRVMPKRLELRKHGRVDLEKAISRFGGFTTLAQKLNMRMAYKQKKPRGYWNNIENLKHEILLFQKKNSSDPAYMPRRKTLERAGRYDIARALEKWGGLLEVASMLNLQISTTQKRLSEEGLRLRAPGRESSTNAQQGPVKTSLPEARIKWLKVDKEG